MRNGIGPNWRQFALAGAAAGCALLTPVAAQGPSLAMLDGLERGQWQVRFRDDGATQRVCLRTGRELIQLRHPGGGCSRYVVEDGNNVVTVQYTCRGSNYGRTSIRRETRSLVQLESQGIDDGLPFQFTAEARRTGSCN